MTRPVNKQILRNLLGQLVSIRNDLEKLIALGTDWELVGSVYDDLRHAIAELERVIDE